MSPVISVLLLVALTLVLFAVFAIAILSMGHLNLDSTIAIVYNK